MMARLLVLACVSFLLIACISAKKNGGAMEETGLAGLEKQQQKMVGEIETIHNAVTKLKLDMKTLLKKASKTDEAVTSINMIDQLLAGAENTGQLNPYKGMSMQSAGQSSGTSGLNMFSQLLAQAMKQQGVMQASDSRTRSDGSTNESSDLSDDEMGASMSHNSQPSTSSDLSDDEMGTSMRHNSQPSTSSDLSDDEMGTNMRPSHSQSASKTDEAVTSINMIDQLLAGAENTGQLNPYKGMSMQSAGQSSGTSGLHMFSQLLAQAMKQQGVMQASDSRTRSDGSTNESSDLSDDEMGASMSHNSQPSTSSDFSDDEMGTSMRHNSQPSTSSDLSDDEMGTSMRHNSQPSTSSDLFDDEMGTNMRPSHSQSAGSTRKDYYTWTMEGGLKSTEGEPVDKREKDTDAYQLPSSGDVQTQTEGTAGQTSPDTGDDDKQS